MKVVYIVYSAYPTYGDTESVDSIYQNPDGARNRMYEIQLHGTKEAWVCEYEVR